MDAYESMPNEVLIKSKAIAQSVLKDVAPELVEHQALLIAGLLDAVSGKAVAENKRR